MGSTERAAGNRGCRDKHRRCTPGARLSTWTSAATHAGRTRASAGRPTLNVRLFRGRGRDTMSCIQRPVCPKNNENERHTDPTPAPHSSPKQLWRREVVRGRQPGEEAYSPELPARASNQRSENREVPLHSPRTAPAISAQWRSLGLECLRASRRNLESKRTLLPLDSAFQAPDSLLPRMSSQL